MPPAPGAKRLGPPPLPQPSGPAGMPATRVPAPPPPLPAGGPQARTLSSTNLPQHPGIAATPAPRQLFIRYQGQSFLVNKDKFIIGRGKQTSDLTIKDPNVSRQHAMIEFDGNQFCIVDLGSTNGIEYLGQRVQRKIVVDGDVIRICDHELVFQYR
jgi:neural Wiskott-Aldrich syndrome protein